MKTISIIGLQVAATNYADAVAWIKDKAALRDRAYAVEAANTHVAALAKDDEKFGEAMSRFDLICPDGMPLVWTLNAQLPADEKLQDRVYGPTLMLETLKATNEDSNNFKHFLLGGKEQTLAKLREKFSRDFPHAQIADAYSPPFGEWSADEFSKIKNKIIASEANLVWVGLGCPKQELWIAQHKAELPPAVYFGIGAAFAFHAGEVKQAPSFIQNIGMEWLYRLACEPRRLFKRYFKYNSLFLYHLMRERMS